MVTRGYDEWEDNSEGYSEGQVEAVLLECDIEQSDSETETDFLCYCPFHNNTDSPAFAISKTTGKWTCFNQSCYQSGDLETLVKRLKKTNVFQTKRLILKHKQDVSVSLAEKRLARSSSELPTFEQSLIDRMHNDFFDSPAQAYMEGRGFSDDTMKTFQIGYSAKKNLVATPMYASIDQPVGIIGRRLPPIDYKFRFYNSRGLPKKDIPWNIQNARTHGDTVIICEANFDAMSIYQAGYPNVVAILGGSLSPWHVQMIDKTFSNIIIMTDFDKKRYDVNCKKCKSIGHRICNGHRPGRDLGRQIAKEFAHKRVRWGAYDDSCVYPDGHKDVNSMLEADPSGETIRQTLKNSISTLQYNRWNIEETLAS